MAKTNPPKPRNPLESDLPFDEALLGEAEARYKGIKAQYSAEGPPAFEALELGATETEAPSRVRIARDLLMTNPPHAIARRLERIGVSKPAAERTAKAVGERAGSSALESLGVESVGDGTVEQLGLERIIGRNELLGVQYLDGGQVASTAVGRIAIRNEQGTTLGYGTGSLIFPRLLLTNNHVLADETIAANSIVEFNYQENVKGELLPVVQFRLEPQTFFATSPAKELDFTIVAVAEKADDGTSLTSFGYKPLHAMEGEILAGESVTIIQHPNGEPKQIALRENLVLKFPEAGDRFLHYQTDTTPGSSGSPVYNDQWEVVALHHSGYPRRDAAGNILATDGRIWKKEMGEHRIDWIANEGIRIRAIVDYLKRIETLTADQVALRDAALAAHELSLAKPDLSQTPFSLSGGAGTATTQPAPASLGTTTGLPIALAGQANWIIPLQVSVSLGTPMTVSGMGVIPTPSGAPGRPSIGPQLPASHSNSWPGPHR